MPFLHKPRKFVPLQIAADLRARKDGLRHSVFTTRKDYYKGVWNHDTKEGKGLFLTHTGKMYEGDWVDGFRQGFGVLSHKTIDDVFVLDYRGEWYKGKFHGVGWRTFDNEDIYFGFWSNGYQHGYGKMWYKNGTFYVGYWKKNLRNGLGMFMQKNGNRYEGTWKDDKRNGPGRFYHLDSGQLQEGYWVNNICIQSTMVDIDIRQFCTDPTPYPINYVELKDYVSVLDKSEHWFKDYLNGIHKQLLKCLDLMIDEANEYNSLKI